MHDLVDKMFDGTDMLHNIQNLYQRTQLHRNTRIYEMVGEASALGLEQAVSNGDEIADILNPPSSSSEDISMEGDGADIIIEEAEEEASKEAHFSGILEEEDDGWEELI